MLQIIHRLIVQIQLLTMKTYLPYFVAFLLLGCSAPKPQDSPQPEAEVVLETSLGNITVRLSNATPLHRDNFIKLVEEGIYDSLLFHRVISGFMVQAGDISSKTATPGDTLGSKDLPYTVPAEFVPSLFHKRGALAAARNDNPMRASSSTQFYIVQGKIHTDSTLMIAEGRINNWLGKHYAFHDEMNKPLLDSILYFMDKKDSNMVKLLNAKLDAVAANYGDYDRYIIPEAHMQVYKTIGGSPHLDQNYTVFGEVIEGMEVVDAIANTPRNELDRPLEDVRILKAKVVR